MVEVDGPITMIRNDALLYVDIKAIVSAST